MHLVIMIEMTYQLYLFDTCREQKGVKVRVELGPRDAQKSQACLAISTVPGQVAKKTTYQVNLLHAATLPGLMHVQQLHCYTPSYACPMLISIVHADCAAINVPAEGMHACFTDDFCTCRLEQS